MTLLRRPFIFLYSFVPCLDQWRIPFTLTK